MKGITQITGITRITGITQMKGWKHLPRIYTNSTNYTDVWLGNGICGQEKLVRFYYVILVYWGRRNDSGCVVW